MSNKTAISIFYFLMLIKKIRFSITREPYFFGALMYAAIFTFGIIVYKVVRERSTGSYRIIRLLPVYENLIINIGRWAIAVGKNVSSIKISAFGANGLNYVDTATIFGFCPLYEHLCTYRCP